MQGFLSLQSPKDAEEISVKQLAETLNLSVDFLVHVNKEAYPKMTTSSLLKPGTVIFLEDEIPADMIDALNEILEVSESDEPEDPIGKKGKGKAVDFDALEPMNLSGAVAMAHKRKRVAPLFPSVAEENAALRELVGRIAGGETVSPADLKKLGVSSGSKPPGGSKRIEQAPKTSEAKCIQEALRRVDERSEQPADEGTTLTKINPMSLFQRRSQSVDTRLAMLEGKNPLMLYSSPEALANATSRLIVENPELTDSEARALQKQNLQRAVGMRAYINAAQLDEKSAERVVKQAQIDMLTDGADDAMIQCFQKRAKLEFDKKLKTERNEGGSDSGSGVASGLKVALEKQADALLKVVHALAPGGRGGRGGRGDGRGGLKGGGNGRITGDGAPGQAHYQGCFVCGDTSHRAADCPEARKTRG